MSKVFTPKTLFAILVDAQPAVKASWFIGQINEMVITGEYTRSHMSIEVGAVQNGQNKTATVSLRIFFTKHLSEALYKAIAVELRSQEWLNVEIDMDRKQISCVATADILGLDLTHAHQVPMADATDAAKSISRLATSVSDSSESEEIGNAMRRLGTAVAEKDKVTVANKEQPFNRGTGINPRWGK